jgi:hypothetical protein
LKVIRLKVILKTFNLILFNPQLLRTLNSLTNNQDGLQILLQTFNLPAF